MDIQTSVQLIVNDYSWLAQTTIIEFSETDKLLFGKILQAMLVHGTFWVLTSATNPRR